MLIANDTNDAKEHDKDNNRRCNKDTNDTNEHDKDTNGRYNKDAKEDTKNIADDMHHNNGEQGHLKFI